MNEIQLCVNSTANEREGLQAINGITLQLQHTSDEIANRIQSYIFEKSKSNQPILVCPLEGCNESFLKENKLRVHLLSHQETRQFKCTFEGCCWAFTSKYRLNRHILSHTSRKNFKCDYPDCSRRYANNYNLNIHKATHDRPNLVECIGPDCNKVFPNRRKMEVHLKEHTNIPASFVCPVSTCQKSFFCTKFLSSHLRIHKYTSEELCCPIPECPKVFERLCQLKIHVRSHTGEKPYACNFEGCNWMFATASKLTRHMRKHTGERKFICPELGCGKSFMRPEHLKGHETVHSKDRPYICTVEGCEARFTAKCSLYVHLKKHGEISFFECSFCNKKYTGKACLKAHVQKFHSSPLGIPETSPIETKGPTLSVPNSSLTDQIPLLKDHLDILGNQVIKFNVPEDASIKVEHIDQEVEVESNETSLSEDLSSAISTQLFKGKGEGGSARTDYCSNLILSSRAKKRRLLRQQFSKDDLTGGSLLDVPLLSDMLSSTHGYVFLSPTSIAGFREEEISENCASLLQDDPVPVELYPDSHLTLAQLSEPILSETCSDGPFIDS